MRFPSLRVGDSIHVVLKSAHFLEKTPQGHWVHQDPKVIPRAHFFNVASFEAEIVSMQDDTLTINFRYGQAIVDRNKIKSCRVLIDSMDSTKPHLWLPVTP